MKIQTLQDEASRQEKRVFLQMNKNNIDIKHLNQQHQMLEDSGTWVF